MALSAPTRPSPPSAHGPSSRGLVLRWLLASVGFPPGGLVSVALGPVDDPLAAAGGGLGAGLVVGAVQWLLLRRPVGLPASWAPATGLGLAVGLTVGARLVGHGTAPVDLVVQGALSGACVGTAQGLVLRRRLGAWPSMLWALAAVLAWPLGWAVTTAFGVDVDRHYAVFGATGALAYGAASSAVMVGLLRPRPR